MTRHAKLRDALERLGWTSLQGFLAGGAVSAIATNPFDGDAWHVAAAAGATALATTAVAAGTLIARWRLARLPDPGHALTDDAHESA